MPLAPPAPGLPGTAGQARPGASARGEPVLSRYEAPLLRKDGEPGGSSSARPGSATREAGGHRGGIRRHRAADHRRAPAASARTRFRPSSRPLPDLYFRMDADGRIWNGAPGREEDLFPPPQSSSQAGGSRTLCRRTRQRASAGRSHGGGGARRPSPRIHPSPCPEGIRASGAPGALFEARSWRWSKRHGRKQVEEAGGDYPSLTEAQRVAQIGWYVFGDLRTLASSGLLDELFGITAPDYPKTVEGWLNLVHPEDRQPMEDYLLSYVVRGHPSSDREYRIVRQRDGEERWAHGRGELVRDRDGQAVKMIGIIQDMPNATGRRRPSRPARPNSASSGRRQGVIYAVTFDMGPQASTTSFVSAQVERLLGYTTQEFLR